MSTLEIKDLYAHVETKDGIKPIQFFWCYIDTLTGIRTCLFVCFMSFLCIIELFGKSTGTYLFT